MNGVQGAAHKKTLQLQLAGQSNSLDPWREVGRNIRPPISPSIRVEVKPPGAGHLDTSKHERITSQVAVVADEGLYWRIAVAPDDAVGRRTLVRIDHSGSNQMLKRSPSLDERVTRA
jgi:hypothetical protein